MILKAKHLSKSYDLKAEIIKDVSLEVKKGESIAIIGPSGAGKSTLLHLLGTLETPTFGSLEIMGKFANAATCAFLRNQHIGFVFQNFNLLEESSVLENILMPAKIARMNTQNDSEAHNRALHLIEQVGLQDHIHQLAKSLSGGEKQRAAIARAFCNEPDLILADEPSGNLDEGNSALIHDLLLSAAKNKKALIVVTHSEALAKLCDRRYRISDGILTSV